MKALISGLLLAAGITGAQAQGAPPLKLGYILDMSGLYADITGIGSVEAARMAVEDAGGSVLGRKVEVVYADHQNKADIAGAQARDFFDNQGVEAILDVAASATALAANEVAKQRNKIIVFNGPGATRLTNEACGPLSVHYVFDTYALAHGTGLATVKRGDDTW
ncbi:MAG: branched-chain amino acid transport system substrate-binding protein, partial [Methylobacteriaceae bacterium]|nr:branched-chain amino acid transport system substrate-binding protein [Methylobacteriaceae bacterium]